MSLLWILSGPFGGGNQDWYKFEIAVMVGGGIGVTPYASILNDLVFGTSTNRYSGVACKKVYFLWICPSHRYFEWFIDVLREVEEKDKTNVLEMHIFITQFFHKFDLRTTMLVSLSLHKRTSFENSYSPSYLKVDRYCCWNWLNIILFPVHLWESLSTFSKPKHVYRP